MRNASIDVNAKNVFGLTALDLLKIRLKDASGDYLNIGRLLQHVEAVNSRNNVSWETTRAAASMMCTVAGGSTLQEILDRFLSKLEDRLHEQKERHEQQERNGQLELESQRNNIMIVASVIAAAAFQAGVNPPGGFWQDTVISNNISAKSHTAGKYILADSFPRVYKIMIYSIVTAFFFSSCIFILLMSGLPPKSKLWNVILLRMIGIAIMAVGFSFFLATGATGSDNIDPWIAYAYLFSYGIKILELGSILVRRCWRTARTGTNLVSTSNSVIIIFFFFYSGSC